MNTIVLIFSAILLSIVMFAGCTKLPTNVDRPESFAFTDTQDTALGQYVAPQLEKNEGKSGFRLLDNGLDAFSARAVLAESAQRSIDVKYYLYKQDLVGKLLTYYLVRAADRGVRVRLMVDDMGMSGRDKYAAAMDSHPNIEVRIFNPFSRNAGRLSQYITRYGSVTRRMHNKSFTVDNQVTILGGRNIGNEYFDADPDLVFADVDVLGVGPVARDVSGVFDIYWNNELAYPASSLYKEGSSGSYGIDTFRKELNAFAEAQEDASYMKALQTSRLVDDIRNRRSGIQWGTSEVVFDQPEKLLHSYNDTRFHLTPMLRPYWENTEKELIIISPYFVPGKEGTALLCRLANRGVRVKILTNSLASNNIGIVHAGYKKYRKELLRNGVTVYELDKRLTRKERKKLRIPGGILNATLHAKCFIFDRKYIFVGSLNLDPRALIHNTEIGVILNVPDIAGSMAVEFDEEIYKDAFRLELKTASFGPDRLVWHGIKDGAPVEYTHEPYVGFWRRFGISFLSLWPIDSQL